MRALGGIILLVALVIGARTLFRNVIGAATADNSTCLDMLGSTTTEEEGQTYITGSVRNNCDRDFGQVLVIFKMDAAPGAFGGLEGSASGSARNVKAGEVREFKTNTPVPKNATYRFERMNAF